MLNVASLESGIKAKADEAAALLKAQSEAAEKENRARTNEEVAAVDKLLGEARDMRAQLDRKKGDDAITAELARLTHGIAPTIAPAVPANAGGLVPARGADPRERMTWGAQFVASPAFEFFKGGGHRTAASWRSPSIELVGVPLFRGGMYGATLTTDPASGGALVVPDYRPGIVPLPFYADVMPAVADLMAPGTTDSNLVTYMREKTFTNAADTVLEGADKPESTLVFEPASDAVRKIAHWLPVTEEMLEDAPQIRAYIDSRLLLGIRLAEDDQLLQGSGTAPDLLGVRVRPGVADAVPKGADNNADAIFKQITAIATTALVQPDGIVMHPANWSPIELMKTTQGEYLAGGPFAARVTRTLWGLPVVMTMAIPAGIATVGAWRTQSQFFRKGGVRVEASNSHADFFIKNLVAIRAEERGALAVYREGAFGDVTGLDPVVTP